MLTLVNTIVDDDNIVTKHYTCDFTVTLAQDGLWGCSDEVVRVTEISTHEGEEWNAVSVTHTGKWQVYTDSAFEQAISDALKRDVRFTEQGMQEDELASMEFADSEE